MSPDQISISYAARRFEPYLHKRLGRAWVIGAINHAKNEIEREKKDNGRFIHGQPKWTLVCVACVRAAHLAGHLCACVRVQTLGEPSWSCSGPRNNWVAAIENMKVCYRLYLWFSPTQNSQERTEKKNHNSLLAQQVLSVFRECHHDLLHLLLQVGERERVR